MYNHHLVEMVLALVGAGIIPDDPEDKQEVQHVLRGCWINKIASCWGIEDVIGVDDTLTEDEAREILYTVHEEQDASIGINWDVIEARVNDFKREKV